MTPIPLALASPPGCDRLLPDLLCAAAAPHFAWQWLSDCLPLAATLVAGILAARLGWHVAQRWAWTRQAAAAQWLQITPPVTANPASTVALWRLLATLLPASRPWTLVPARLVWEVHAAGEETRCGLWVPSSVNPAAVRRAVQRAWPGARVDDTPAPQLPQVEPVAGRRLSTRQPAWEPLLDQTPANLGPWSPSAPEDDPARAVYGGLAATDLGGAGLLQVTVARAPARDVATLRKACTDPATARSGRPAARVAGVALRVAVGLLRAVLDLADPHAHHRPHGHSDSRGVEPHLADQARAARARLAAGPLFLISVKASAAAPTREAARSAASDIASGYALLTGRLRPRRTAMTRTLARTRWAPRRHLVLATAAEAAAFAAVPAEPSLYGMPAAPARRRAPAAGTWRATGAWHATEPRL